MYMKIFLALTSKVGLNLLSMLVFVSSFIGHFLLRPVLFKKIFFDFNYTYYLIIIANPFLMAFFVTIIFAGLMFFLRIYVIKKYKIN